MPFFVYGTDAKTGEVVHRFFSEATTDDEARRHGQAHGIQVTAVVPCDESDRPKTAADLPPLSPSASASAADPALRSEMTTFRETLDELTPYAFVTYGLIGVNTIVYLWMVVTGADAMDPSTKDLLRAGAEFGPLTMNGQWWRLFSCLFVHIGFFHLAYNMLAFAYAGPYVERMIGNAGYLLLYLVAGLAGSLWSLYFNPLLLHAGASGAIFGVYGALLALMLPTGTVPPHVAAAFRKFVLIFIVYNAIYSFQPNIGAAAHFGGAVAGFFCGLLARQPFSQTAVYGRPLHDTLIAIAGILLFGIGIAGINAIYPNLADLQERLARFDAIDQSVVKTYEDAQSKHDSERVDDGDFADTIERDVLPSWRETHELLRRQEPIPTKLAKFVEPILDYMKKREDGWNDLVEGLRAGDKEQIDHAIDDERRLRSDDRTLQKAARVR